MASELTAAKLDIQEQEATFAMFNGLTKWGSLAITSLLVWLVLGPAPHRLPGRNLHGLHRHRDRGCGPEGKAGR